MCNNLFKFLLLTSTIIFVEVAMAEEDSQALDKNRILDQVLADLAQTAQKEESEVIKKCKGEKKLIACIQDHNRIYYKTPSGLHKLDNFNNPPSSVMMPNLNVEKYI